MSSDAIAAVAETAAKAKQLLFNADGKLKGPDHFVSLFTMQYLVPLATGALALNPQPGSILYTPLREGCW
jgi:hypothetical protein